MSGIVCGNCGAPLEVSAAAAAIGFVKCPYCLGSTPLARAAAPAETRRATAAATDSPSVRIGIDQLEIPRDQLDAPVERPAGTRIDIEQQPGAHFRLLMPRQNVTAVLVFAGILAGGLGGGGIGIVAAVTATAASFGHGQMAFAISTTALVIALGVGVWFLVRVARARNEIDARGGKVLIINRGVTTKIREFHWSVGADLAFDRIGISLQNPPLFCLGLNTDAGRVPLFDFFFNTTAAELRWIRTEWLRFFAPLRTQNST